MKKIFFLAIVAATAIACSKSEDVYTPAEEISFMPVSRIESKAAVEGTEFTANQNFYVFANTLTSDSQNNKKYFENILFVPLSGSTVDNPNVGGDNPLQVYHGSPTQYWPNVTALKFAGVTASGNVNITVNGVTPAMSDDFNSMTLETYKQPSPTIGDANNDLMYFFDDNSGTGYVKGTTAQVIPVMKHACSWLTFNIQTVDELVNDTDDTKSYWKNFVVTNVSLKGLYESGKVTLTPNNVPNWDFTEMTASSSVDVLNSEKKVKTTSSEFANFAKNTIVIPQDPTELYVSYKYKTPAGVEIEETKEIDLTDYTVSWAAGKHYVYNLTVTAEEIKIAPASTDWVTIPSTEDI